MGIRIRPKEIEIPDNPEGDPFKNDSLGRKDSAEILTHIVGSIEGPCTMAVDAPWGAGKTTFIRLWHRHLVNNGFTVIRFNAWENDFYDDPFVALCAELSADQNTGIDKNKLMEAGAEVMKHVAWNVSGQVVATLSAGTVNLSELAKAHETAIKERLNQYQDAKDAISDFRGTLQSMAVPASTEKPLIVMIDELDRCRPSYAVELLEVAKHLFSVDNIIFVLAINRSELEHSIKAIYGTGFNAEGYLERFFDVDFNLPAPDRRAFINSLFNAIQLNDYFNRTKDPNARRLAELAEILVQKFSIAFNLSLRQIEQAIHRLGLVFASIPDSHYSFFQAAMAALILRTINMKLYHDFVNGRVSDLEVVEKVFGSHQGAILQQTLEGRLFEATLIMAYRELMAPVVPNESSFKTPLESRYNEKQTEWKIDNTDDPTEEHWHKVLELVESYKTEPFRYTGGSSSFMTSVKRIELLSREMMDEGQE